MATDVEYPRYDNSSDSEDDDNAFVVNTANHAAHRAMTGEDTFFGLHPVDQYVPANAALRPPLPFGVYRAPEEAFFLHADLPSTVKTPNGNSVIGVGDDLFTPTAMRRPNADANAAANGAAAPHLLWISGTKHGMSAQRLMSFTAIVSKSVHAQFAQGRAGRPIRASAVNYDDIMEVGTISATARGTVGSQAAFVFDPDGIWTINGILRDNGDGSLLVPVMKN